jgi:hypothetical protein
MIAIVTAFEAWSLHVTSGGNGTAAFGALSPMMRAGL